MDIRNKLIDKGLKVTPQRMAILEAIIELGNHPTAENIISYIKKEYPNIATGTVYKVLAVLVDNNLVRKVVTDKDISRYDGFTERHHHLHSPGSDVIGDYIDKELDEMLEAYFKKKKLPGFKIDNFTLHINGRFN